MILTAFDLLVFALFFAAVVGLSLYKSHRGRNSEEYFLAGRSLNWWLIGFSIVAANISTEQFVGMAGQSAGGTGLAVSAWQLVGSAGIVIIAFTLLPRFLRAGIYTIPEFLEYRYNPLARVLLAGITVIIYVAVLLSAVLYSGGLTMHTLFGLDLRLSIFILGFVAALYTTIGGLKAVAWADLIQGMGLLVGGLLTFFLGVQACGGWDTFSTVNASRLHIILPVDHPELPWTGVLSGMWIVILYYCGLNQFIVQRNLAARSLRDGQLGVIFAGALWLLVPFAIVMPGIMAHQLYPEQLRLTPDQAYPLLMRHLIPSGLKGFMCAAIAGAVTSSLASMLNSAATICTMDLYPRLVRKDTPPSRLVWLGRGLTMLFILVACLLAPALADPRFKGVFNFIQQFQGYIWPGTVAAFLFGIYVPRTPAAAGATALLSGPAFYGLFQYLEKLGLIRFHFLLQVALAFALVCLVLGIMTWLAPLREPRRLPERALVLRTEPLVKVMGGLVMAGVILFFLVFR